MNSRIIITGTRGTLGQQLVPFMQEKGFDVLAWNRSMIPVDDYHQMENFIQLNNPKALIHLAAITSLDENDRINSWQVNYEWPSELAWICRIHQIKFIFTSSAMVFSQQQNGPFSLESIPDEQSGYGLEKRLAEERVLSQNPDSVILRLGWQIAEDKAGSPESKNSMIASLDKQMKNTGKIKASTKWFPSCSYVQDTVGIMGQSLTFSEGIYQLNSNTDWSFFQIVTALKNYFNKDWNIVQTKDYEHDQRMIDDRIKIKTLNERFSR